MSDETGTKAQRYLDQVAAISAARKKLGQPASKDFLDKYGWESRFFFVINERTGDLQDSFSPTSPQSIGYPNAIVPREEIPELQRALTDLLAWLEEWYGPPPAAEVSATASIGGGTTVL